MKGKRTAEYQKDSTQEQLLARINKLLAPLERGLVEKFNPPQKPVLFIVGAPRAATTLIHQLIAQTGYFGYISNYLARFWMAPYFGALQEKALQIRQDTQMSFKSNYGRTHEWHGPHQFNYFWQRWYQFGNDHQMDAAVISAIDCEYFKRELGALQCIFQKSLVFKSLYCGLQMGFLKNTLEKAKFVICTRDPLFQAQSILLGRKAFFDDYDGWFSLKPPQYLELKKLDPFAQVAGQIFYILKAIGKSIHQMSNEEYVVIDQDDIVERPRKAIEGILRMADINEQDIINSMPRSFENRNKQRLAEPQWNLLKDAVEEFFHGKSSLQILLNS